MVRGKGGGGGKGGKGEGGSGRKPCSRWRKKLMKLLISSSFEVIAEKTFFSGRIIAEKTFFSGRIKDLAGAS